MKFLGGMAALVGAIGLCLVSQPAHAADKYDGSVPFVCVPTAVAECVRNGECRTGTAENENLPDFFRINLKSKVVHAEGEGKGRQSPIKEIHRSHGELSLYGAQNQRAWILIIQEKTGRMSASITGDGLSFVIFGVCPAP
jgi:hypothetical protein